jgi:site-specific recombinase XerD
MKLHYYYQRAQQYAAQLYLEPPAGDAEQVLSTRAVAILLLLGTDTGLKLTDLLKTRFSGLDGETLSAEIGRTGRTKRFKVSFTTRHYLEVYRSWLQVMGASSDLIFYNPAAGKAFTRQWAYKKLNKLIATSALAVASPAGAASALKNISNPIELEL